MNVAEFHKKIDLIFIKVGNLFDLRDAVVLELRLIGSTISGEFHLASGGQRPKWKCDGRLTLRNTAVGFLHDEPAAWPPHLNLDKFTYEGFGGPGANAATDVAIRGSKWFEQWLARAEPYTPQPYQQCAKVLREMGHPEVATDVLYAGRERERREAFRTGNNPHATGLTLLKWVIGYGYGSRLLWRPLGWVAAFTAVGTAALYIAGMPNELAGSAVAPAFFSFDLLLPIIQLHEPHYQIVLEGAAKYYFAIHKLMGYVLASFLIAGLAGLTK